MDNRLPILRDAAMKALQAISDVGIDRTLAEESYKMGEAYIKKLIFMMDRSQETGKTLDERLKEAHGLLQEALKLFEEDQ